MGANSVRLGRKPRKRVLVTGGAGFIGSHLCRRLLERGENVLCLDNYFTGTRDNIAELLSDPNFEAIRHDVTFPMYLEVDEIYNLACPASPVHYQYDPVQTTKTSVHGAINVLGLAKRCQREGLAGVDERGLRRPGGPSPARELLGTRQSDWPPGVLRRGEAVCRDALLRLSPTAPRPDQGRPDLQHLRSEHATRRWPGRVEFHQSGPRGQVADDLRRWTPDPLLLLRRRPRGGADPADGFARRSDGADQSRAVRGIHDARARPSSCSRRRARSPRSCTSPCRPTIRRSGIRTSAARGRFSIGIRSSICRGDFARRCVISASSGKADSLEIPGAKMEPTNRFERSTCSLRVSCSTN